MKGVVLASTPASPHTPRRDPPAGALRMLRTATAPSRLTTAAAMAATTSAGMPLSTTGALGAAGAGLTSALGAAAGAGMASVFRDLGVDGVISGGQTMNPSTEDILREVARTPAEIVFVLPNNKNIIMAAEQAQKLADRKVIVLPTRTIPQGMTAMLNFDPEAKPDENAVNMMQAADHVSTGLVTYAARDSEFDGKTIRQGEIMALENGKIVATGTDIVKMTYRLARSMRRKDTQFITVISGCDVSEEDAQRTLELVQAKVGDGIEVTLINGGQPVYYYMISVE